jgi:hypothetical protein
MDDEARRQVSERMKHYWARQRELRTSAQSDPGSQPGQHTGPEMKAGWRFQDGSVSLAGPDCGERVTHHATGSIQ